MSERGDLVDRATERAQEILGDAIGEIRRAARDRETKPSAMHCCSCGGEIPPARRVAILGVQECVHCAAEHEARQNMFGKK